jgi:hypothetical protein
MELGALKVSKLCEQIAQPLMGLRMIGFKPQSHLVVRACACRVPAAEQQVGQVHVRHWIVRMMSNSLGVDGTCRVPMPCGGQKRAEIVQRTKMRRRSLEDVKISLPRVEGATQGVKEGRAFDFRLDGVRFAGKKVIKLSQPRLLSKPRAPGRVAACHVISRIFAPMSRPPEHNARRAATGRCRPAHARGAGTLDPTRPCTAGFARARAHREFLSRSAAGGDFS